MSRWIDGAETRMFRKRNAREGETIARSGSIESIESCFARTEPTNDGPFASRNVAGTYALGSFEMRKYWFVWTIVSKQIKTEKIKSMFAFFFILRNCMQTIDSYQ